MNLNKTAKTLCAALSISAVFALYAWASNRDYESEILYIMPQEAFEQICLDLGDDCSDRQIVEMYMSNKKHYDSLCMP